MTSFTPDTFHKKKTLKTEEYLKLLTDEAIKGGLLEQKEIDTFSACFTGHRYPPRLSVQLFENLVKLRLRAQLDKEHYDKMNEEANTEGSFINEILKAIDNPKYKKK